MAFVEGSSVHLAGIQARPELNGQKGMLIRFLHNVGRWEVQLDGAPQGSSLSLSPANLKLCDESPKALAEDNFDDSRVDVAVGSYVRVVGIQARPELNGRCGLALHFASGKSRWQVLLEGSPYEKPLSVKPGNLEALPRQFHAQEVAGKGLGMLATSKIKKGSLILAEKPAFMMSAVEGLTAKMAGVAVEESVLVDKVRQLAPDARQAFWSLHDCKMHNGKKSARGIFETNAIATGEASSADTLNGLCILGSRFNHGCQPNVSRVWKDNLGLEVFRAATDVSKGSELCIYYVDVRRNRRERQAQLKASFDFVCSCEVCRLEGNAQAASDKLRDALLRLDSEVVDGSQNPQDALAKVKRVLDIIQRELAGNPWWFKRAYYDGFQWALGAGDLELAKSMMKQAIENKVLCEGDYPDDQMVNFRKWAVNPLLKLSGSL